MFEMLFIAAQPFILIICPVLSVESREWRLQVLSTMRMGGRKGDSKNRDVLCSQGGHRGEPEMTAAFLVTTSFCWQRRDVAGELISEASSCGPTVL